jgi:Raf kinase inhibitor-like YbhB/YbcL family protein
MNTTTATITLESDAFRDGDTMPAPHVYDGMGCTGKNQSPPLRWSGVPDDAKSLAIAMHDPDAPTGVGFTHWIAFDLPPGTPSLGAGAGDAHGLPRGASHGTNDFGNACYDGPCPPPGPAHRYHITLYALDLDELTVPAHTTYALFRFLIRDHILAQGMLTAHYASSDKST